MINKKLLNCFSVLVIAMVIVFGQTLVNAQTIIPSAKPELIEESESTGKLESFLENQNNKFSNSNIGNNGDTSYENNGDSMLGNVNNILGTSDVSMDSFGNTVVSRILDVLALLQKFSKPFLIIMFIFSALTSLISLVFGGKNFKNGLLGMMFSILAYVGIMYAPDLVIFFAGWLSA